MAETPRWAYCLVLDVVGSIPEERRWPLASLNRPQFAPPITQHDSSTFGDVIAQANQPRQIQSKGQFLTSLEAEHHCIPFDVAEIRQRLLSFQIEEVFRNG